jgi:hypothetical protein
MPGPENFQKPVNDLNVGLASMRRITVDLTLRTTDERFKPNRTFIVPLRAFCTSPTREASQRCTNVRRFNWLTRHIRHTSNSEPCADVYESINY